MVADALVYHPTVAHYLRYMATVTGRDKLMRTIQFFARFYVWYLARTNGDKTDMAMWTTVKKQFSLVRKFLRVGKNVEHIKAAAVAYDNKTLDPIQKYLAVGRQLGIGIHLTLDAATVLHSAGIRAHPNVQQINLQSNRFLLLGISCSIAGQLYTLYQLNERAASVNRKEGEGVVDSKRIDRERAQSRLQLLCDFADIMPPLTDLGYINADDGMIGIGGMFSGLVGIRNAWLATA